MSRQIQLRRGTTADHETFTGALGEITVDTTANTLRVHDGQTPGGTTLAKRSEIPDLTGTDYVIAWQTPTINNNYTWYRKYKSSWVEMGGRTEPGTGNKQVVFPIAMLDTYYTISTCDLSGSSGGVVAYGAGGESTTGFTVFASNTSNSGAVCWCVFGFAK